MGKIKCLSFKINSNIERYKLIFSSECDNSCKTICSKTRFLSYQTKSRFLRLTFLPLSNEYKSIFYILDIRCNKQYCFNLTFIKKFKANQQFYNFYLIDRNYGLKLNAILNFNKID